MQSGKGCQPLKDDDMSFNYINRFVWSFYFMKTEEKEKS